ncbi:hypothetical protein TRIATDRAFT_302783 [Trichoderma atroviride IMI 206040]|uniref:Uncharacterized protein n=1 Tax=Hypocrea atroviridis (strain ATCC 20476 / IMI 206040) TaxID=452589 RepID=G9P9X4_HYPAI|nr:uncharacterized protein TRIATDRAFT_302783 [Trichoderma atroviride IMI 206040]EHK40445.1 hypothetical protein TRIATDRAFT_302783 [Trichoderma atroviride IMI 206040]
MLSVLPPLISELIQFVMLLRIFRGGQRRSPQSSMLLYEIRSFLPICYSHLTLRNRITLTAHWWIDTPWLLST